MQFQNHNPNLSLPFTTYTLVNSFVFLWMVEFISLSWLISDIWLKLNRQKHWSSSILKMVLVIQITNKNIKTRSNIKTLVLTVKIFEKTATVAFQRPRSCVHFHKAKKDRLYQVWLLIFNIIVQYQKKSNKRDFEKSVLDTKICICGRRYKQTYKKSWLLVTLEFLKSFEKLVDAETIQYNMKQHVTFKKSKGRDVSKTIKDNQFITSSHKNVILGI